MIKSHKTQPKTRIKTPKNSQLKPFSPLPISTSKSQKVFPFSVHSKKKKKPNQNGGERRSQNSQEFHWRGIYFCRRRAGALQLFLGFYFRTDPSWDFFRDFRDFSLVFIFFLGFFGVFWGFFQLFFVIFFFPPNRSEDDERDRKIKKKKISGKKPTPNPTFFNPKRKIHGPERAENGIPAIPSPPPFPPSSRFPGNSPQKKKRRFFLKSGSPSDGAGKFPG